MSTDTVLRLSTSATSTKPREIWDSLRFRRHGRRKSRSRSSRNKSPIRQRTAEKQILVFSAIPKRTSRGALVPRPLLKPCWPLEESLDETDVRTGEHLYRFPIQKPHGVGFE